MEEASVRIAEDTKEKGEALPRTHVVPDGLEKKEVADELHVLKLPFDETASFLLHRASKLVNNRIRRRLSHVGISFSEWVVLRVLRDHESLSMCELSRRTHRLPSHITTLVDVLEKRGMVQRLPDEGDRRVTRIQLTQQGRHFLEDEIIRDIIVKSPLQISREKRALLCQLLKEILEG